MKDQPELIVCIVNRCLYSETPQVYPFCYNLFNLEIANSVFSSLQLKYLDTNIYKYIKNTSIVFNNYEK